MGQRWAKRFAQGQVVGPQLGFSGHTYVQLQRFMSPGRTAATSGSWGLFAYGVELVQWTQHRLLYSSSTHVSRKAHTLPCRFYAVVELERALSDNPHKALLIEALERKRSNNFDSFFERLISELFITGQQR